MKGRFVYIFIILFGLIFLISGIGVGVSDHKQKVRCTDEVTAVVIENIRKESTDSDGAKSITFSPVFQYSYNGKEYKTEPGYSSNPPEFNTGDQTQVFVDPSAPEEIYVPAMKTASFLSKIFIVLGSIFATIGVLLFLKGKRI